MELMLEILCARKAFAASFDNSLAVGMIMLMVMMMVTMMLMMTMMVMIVIQT